MSMVTVFDIKRFAVHDGPGIRTTVFMKGCPMDCWWCHNPESRKKMPEEVVYLRKLGEREIESKKVYGKSMTFEEVMDEVLKDKLFYEESGGGVTFSGGEPLYQAKTLLELVKICKSHGLHVTIDTCGYSQWENFEKLLPFTDLILYDLKLVDKERHLKFTGVKNELILENLAKLFNANANVELRIPFIPGVNDLQAEIEKYTLFLQEKIPLKTKIHLLPYHTIANDKYTKLNANNRMIELEKTNGILMSAFEDELKSAGFIVGIGG